MKKLCRREVLQRGAGVFAALTVLPLARVASAAEPACVEPDSESLRESLSYVDPAKAAEQSCRTCGFFEGTTACGNCQIMTGPVNATAHCEAWSAKS